MKVLRAAFGLPLAMLLASSAAAQDNSMLTGRVLDMQTEGPVVAAQVELLSESGRRLDSTTSDTLGWFAFSDIGAASYLLRVNSSGFHEVTTQAVELAADDTSDIIVWMSVDAVPIAPLEVVVRSRRVARHSGLEAFYRRSELKMGGSFLSAKDISARNPSRVSDLMRTMGSITVMGETIVNNRTRCAPEVWINGMRHSGPPFEIVNTVEPASIEGIEVYAGAATVPAELGGSRARCGVISIWQKRGD